MIQLHLHALLDGILRSLILYLLMDFGVSAYAATASGSVIPMLLACAAAGIASFLCTAIALRSDQNKTLLKCYGLSASAFILCLGLLGWFFGEVLPNFTFFPPAEQLSGLTMYYAIVCYFVTLALRIAVLIVSLVWNLRANHRRLGG